MVSLPTAGSQMYFHTIKTYSELELPGLLVFWSLEIILSSNPAWVKPQIKTYLTDSPRGGGTVNLKQWMQDIPNWINTTLRLGICTESDVLWGFIIMGGDTVCSLCFILSLMMKQKQIGPRSNGNTVSQCAADHFSNLLRLHERIKGSSLSLSISSSQSRLKLTWWTLTFTVKLLWQR